MLCLRLFACGRRYETPQGGYTESQSFSTNEKDEWTEQKAMYSKITCRSLQYLLHPGHLLLEATYMPELELVYRSLQMHSGEHWGFVMRRMTMQE